MAEAPEVPLSYEDIVKPLELTKNQRKKQKRKERRQQVKEQELLGGKGEPQDKLNSSDSSDNLDTFVA